MQRWWVLVLGGIVAIVIGFGAGYLVFDDGHGSDDDHGLGRDRMASMMADGSMPEMMDDFVGMMEQMRGSMTPEMRAEMDENPMWDLMAGGELAAMMQDHMGTMRDMPGMGGRHDGGGRHGSG
jgi:hypothetical protein